MSRTERPVSDHAGEPAPPSVRIEPHDLDVYRHFTDHVSPKLAGSAITYWLSVPLPAQALGDRYQISRDIDFPATRSVPRLGVTNCFKPPKDGWGSAKLRALNSLVPTEALALPWVLPSLTLVGAFRPMGEGDAIAQDADLQQVQGNAAKSGSPC